MLLLSRPNYGIEVLRCRSECCCLCSTFEKSQIQFPWVEIRVIRKKEHIFKRKRACNLFDTDHIAHFDYCGQLQTVYTDRMRKVRPILGLL